MKNKFFIFIFLLFSIFGYSYGSVYANNNNNIVYKNYNDGKLYKKNANDVSNGSAINTVSVGNGFSFSPDGQYIIYSNSNDGGKLYKKNANDVSNGSAITTGNVNFPVYSPDGQFIYYIGVYNGIFQIFKKNANDVSNGSVITTSNFNKYYINISPDGQYILYTNSGDGNKLYRKNANDVSNGSAINSVGSQYASYSPDSKWIIYINLNDNGKIYKKNANDVSNGSAINSFMSLTPSYSPDGQYIIYRNENDSGKLYKKNANDLINGSAINTVSSIYGKYEFFKNKPLYCEKVQGSVPQYFTGSLISLTNNINDYEVNQINNINFQFGSKNGRSNITFLTDDTLETYYYNSSGVEVTSTGEINQTFFDNNSYFSFNNFPASNISNFVRTSTKTFNKIYVSGSNFDYKLELFVNDNFVYYGKFKSNQYIDFINSFGGYNDVNAVRITPQNGYQIGGYKIYYTNFYSSYSEYVENEVCYYSNNIVTVDGQTVDLEHYNDVVENSVNNSFLSEYQTYFEKNCSNLNMFSQFTNLDCLFAKFVLWFKDLDFLKGITNFFNQIKNIFNFSANPTSSITINHFLSSNGNSTNLVLSYNYNDIKNKLVIKEGIIKNYVNSVDKSGFIFINWIFYIIFIFIYFLSASFISSLFIGIGISIYYFIDKIFNQIYLNSFASDVTSNNVFTTVFKFTIISFVFTIFFYLTNPVINNIIQINNFIKNFVSGILNYFYLILNYNSSFNIIDGINFISDKGFGFISTGIFIFLLGKVARLF